ncbi:MAG: cytochrome c biogenesis protein ResB, partial [Anaerolineae bacterium]|nr:cytochrome c biogenesis protein ResB [Anaerolineae bacterium]
MASFRRVWHLSTRLEVAALLMLLLLVLAALLSLFPQFPQVAPADPERLARWEASVSARYGGLARLLDKLGLFHPSRSPVLWLPLGLLVLTTVLCTLGRWRAVWGEALPGQRMDCAPSDAPYASRLPLPSSDMLQGERLAHLMQELGHILAQRGFRVRMVTGALLCGERNRLAALATLVTHLAVLLLVGGLLLSYGYGWREEVTAGPEETVAIKHVRGLALCQEGFAISRYPDGSAAGYEVRLSVVENGGTVAAGVVRLNEPLSFHSLHI